MVRRLQVGNRQVIIIPPGLPPVNQRIIRGAQADIPILENPIGSNRSPEIDAWAKKWGVPLGSPWCAGWTNEKWIDAGADTPPWNKNKSNEHPWIADWWRRWALLEGLFSHEPVLGAAVLYGRNGHEPASHIACCVVSIRPILMDLEGNTSETGFSREGELTDLKRVNVDRLIGYIHPRPRGGPRAAVAA